MLGKQDTPDHSESLDARRASDTQQNGPAGIGGARGGRVFLGRGCRGGRGGRGIAGAGVPPPPGAIFVKGQRGVTIVKQLAATKTGLTLGGALC